MNESTPGPAAYPAAWHPDPTGRHEHRYWDGRVWTDRVSNAGVESSDTTTDRFWARLRYETRPPTDPDTTRLLEMIHADPPKGAGIDAVDREGDGTLWGEPLLVVCQQVKIGGFSREISHQYRVVNQHLEHVGSAHRVGVGAANVAGHLLADVDSLLTQQLEVRDADDRVVLRLVRPRKLLKSTVVVGDAQGTEIGRIVQRRAVGRIRFDLELAGAVVGSMRAEDLLAHRVEVVDAEGRDVARIVKPWDGVASTLGSPADNYVMSICDGVPQPLLSLVIAAPFAVDTALKPTARGGGG